MLFQIQLVPLHRGGMEAAAKAHLASGRAAAAVRALLRRGPGGARAAAEVALLANVRGRGLSLAYNRPLF